MEFYFVRKLQISACRTVNYNIVGWGLAPTSGNMLHFCIYFGEDVVAAWHSGGKPPPYGIWYVYYKQYDKHQFSLSITNSPRLLKCLWEFPYYLLFLDFAGIFTANQRSSCIRFAL